MPHRARPYPRTTFRRQTRQQCAAALGAPAQDNIAVQGNLAHELHPARPARLRNRAGALASFAVSLASDQCGLVAGIAKSANPACIRQVFPLRSSSSPTQAILRLMVGPPRCRWTVCLPAYDLLQDGPCAQIRPPFARNSSSGSMRHVLICDKFFLDGVADVTFCCGWVRLHCATLYFARRCNHSGRV